MLPTFIGVGAQRCGTTWAYECLAAHPEVFVSTPKELRYFSQNYELGISWYESHFKDARPCQARGEITVGYIYRHFALERIAQDLPSVQLLLFLRNPVERAYSSYAFFRHRDYPRLSFREAIISDERLLQQGLYAASIERLWELFPRKQCHIVIYDDIETHPDVALADMYRFVGVDSNFSPAHVTQRRNTPVFPRTQAALARAGLNGLIRIAKKSPFAAPLRQLGNWQHRNALIMDEGDRTWLAQYYAEDVDRVGKLVERDLSHWTRIP